MRHVISLVAGAAVVAALVMPVFASDMTVKGEVVDVACSLAKKERQVDQAGQLSISDFGFQISDWRAWNLGPAFLFPVTNHLTTR